MTGFVLTECMHGGRGLVGVDMIKASGAMDGEHKQDREAFGLMARMVSSGGAFGVSSAFQGGKLNRLPGLFE